MTAPPLSPSASIKERATGQSQADTAISASIAESCAEGRPIRAISSMATAAPALSPPSILMRATQRNANTRRKVSQYSESMPNSLRSRPTHVAVSPKEYRAVADCKRVSANSMLSPQASKLEHAMS
ncbi:MAG: hypothetical protein JFR24_03185 [Muribaculaceae bacterium]|nr:hypothetical protein [Muribaculaceae bacterium]